MTIPDFMHRNREGFALLLLHLVTKRFIKTIFKISFFKSLFLNVFGDNFWTRAEMLHIDLKAINLIKQTILYQDKQHLSLSDP